MRKMLCVLLSVILVMTLVPIAAFASTNADRYEEAIDLLQANKFDEAAEAFASLGFYMDSNRYAMYSRILRAGENGNFTEAIFNLGNLGDFLDSSLLIKYYTGLMYERNEEYQKAQDELVTISLYRDVWDRLEKYPDLIMEQDYKAACTTAAEGKLEKAYDAFWKLGNYKDSEEQASALAKKINEAKQLKENERKEKSYNDALSDEQNNDYVSALAKFKELGDYKDSAEHVASIEALFNESKVGHLNAKVNFRSGPGTDYEKIDTIPVDSECTIYETVIGSDGKEWSHIDFNGNSGYVLSSFIDLDE